MTIAVECLDSLGFLLWCDFFCADHAFRIQSTDPDLAKTPFDGIWAVSSNPPSSATPVSGGVVYVRKTVNLPALLMYPSAQSNSPALPSETWVIADSTNAVQASVKNFEPGLPLTDPPPYNWGALAQLESICNCGSIVINCFVSNSCHFCDAQLFLVPRHQFECFYLALAMYSCPRTTTSRCSGPRAISAFSLTKCTSSCSKTPPLVLYPCSATLKSKTVAAWALIEVSELSTQCFSFNFG